MDHKTFLNMIVSGSKTVISHRDHLNEINVFPVPDGDTGSNLAYLMKTIVQDTKINDDSTESMTSFKKAALKGSRGNSGMIFSQFFINMANGILNKEMKNTADFIHVCEHAAAKTYNSVMSPEEGTVLTVMRDWILAMKESAQPYSPITKTIADSLEYVYHSLEKTKVKMEEISGRRVVDSGAQGFVYFLEGLVYQHSRGDDVLKKSFSDFEEITHSIHKEDFLNHRFCTEVILEGVSNTEKVKEIALLLGDSVVMAGDEEQLKLHLHSNEPHTVMEQLSHYGDLTFQKVEDMKRQYETIYERKSKIAIVVDSACDLSEEFMEKHQIYLLPATIEIGRSVYLDKITMRPDDFYNKLEELEKAPKTSQPGLELIIRTYEQLAKHYDHILSIHVSSELSGTYKACKMAAEQVNPQKISVLNSKTLSGAYGLLINKIAETREQGASLEELVTLTESLSRKTEILVSVPTLKHMIRGGRVTPLQGKIANLLKMRPIVSVDEEGKSKLYGKTFFRNSNLKKMFSMIHSLDKKNTIEEYVILHANDLQKAAQCEDRMKALTGRDPAYIANVSPVIGAHAGKGSVSVAMLLKENK